MKGKATTVEEYLKQLPEDRRAAVQAVRKVILKHLLPEGLRGSLAIRHARLCRPAESFPAGYLNRKNEPVPYVCLASQKNYMKIYLMSVYGDAEGTFRKEYEATGKKLDMGKSCVRFKKVEDLPLNVIGKAVAKWPMKKWIAMSEAAWKSRKR